MFVFCLLLLSVPPPPPPPVHLAFDVLFVLFQARHTSTVFLSFIFQAAVFECLSFLLLCVMARVGVAFFCHCCVVARAIVLLLLRSFNR